MKTVLKITTAAVLAGAMALAAATTSEARNGRIGAAAIGFGAGALVGAAAASSYNNGYYYGAPGYAYAPAPAYYGDYAYEPAPVYVDPGPTYYYSGSPYQGSRSRNCTSSPASQNFGASC